MPPLSIKETASLILSDSIYQSYIVSEEDCLLALQKYQSITLEQKEIIEEQVRQQILSAKTLQSNAKPSPIQQILQKYSLDTEEGIALMCLANSFLSIPDTETAITLLEDVHKRTQWHPNHLKVWQNTSTWKFLLGNNLTTQSDSSDNHILKQLFRKMGQPLALNAIQQIINSMTDQFIYASSLSSARQRFDKEHAATLATYHFDALTHTAMTAPQAQQNKTRYLEALNVLPEHSTLSLKLSALHPKHLPHQQTALKTLSADVIELALIAQDKNICLMIAGEESFRLEPTLNLLHALLHNSAIDRDTRIGITIQAYQKRALPILKWLKLIAETTQRRLPIRLVKGTYWHHEIQAAQQFGLENYPVLTQKSNTDLSYLCCGQYMLANPHTFIPIFSSHNPFTLTALSAQAQALNHSDFYLQRFFGMGEFIYQQIERTFPGIQQSLYTPIGNQQEISPYLSLRLLDHGSEQYFIHQFNKQHQQLIKHDLTIGATHTPLSLQTQLHQQPRSIVNLFNEQETQRFLKKLLPYWKIHHSGNDQDQLIYNPATLEAIGSRQMTPAQDIHQSIDQAHEYFNRHWKFTSTLERVDALKKVAKLLKKNQLELVSLLIRENGKTLHNAQEEIKEAIHYCDYYAEQALQYCHTPLPLPNKLGEINELTLMPLGVIICISPWNFPLSILIGQIAVALVAGNCVIAKPATLGELVARAVARLFLQAGFNQHCLQITPCAARVFATASLNHPKVNGICFTGSNKSAKQIYQHIAQRPGPIIKFLAETGSTNAMIVDSTVCLADTIKDILKSAFDHTGQRSSAIRILLVQKDIANSLITQLAGAMAMLNMGDPAELETDIGPMISPKAKEKLHKHLKHLEKSTSVQILYQTPFKPTEHTQNGYFFSPTLVEIPSLKSIDQEVFGPILHLVRYDTSQLDTILDEINQLGFGLTVGIQTQIHHRAKTISDKIQVGNVYINRPTVAATVGEQPFGGIQQSGTASKSGGPYTIFNVTYQKIITQQFRPHEADIPSLDLPPVDNHNSGSS